MDLLKSETMQELALSVNEEKSRRFPKEQNFSSRLYRINWHDHFPCQLTDRIRVNMGQWKDVANFYQTHNEEIYQEDRYSNSFLSAERHSNKELYYKEMGDCFLFLEEQKLVGVFVGTPTDWSSYYLRNCSVLPQFQSQKIYQKFLVQLLEILRQHGVCRAEGDVAPSNLGHIHVLNKFQFNITGLWMSERWGALLHFTKFLESRSEQVFLKQFCHGVRPQIENQNTRESF